MSWQEAEINKNLSFNLDLDSSDMQRGHASESSASRRDATVDKNLNNLSCHAVIDRNLNNELTQFSIVNAA